MDPLPERLLLFDGVCAVCDATVLWVLDHDPEGRFAFAPLQGPTATRILERHPELPKRIDSLILVERDATGAEQLSWYSTAVLRVACGLGPPWSLARPLLFLPRLTRDPLYRAFAAVRYRVFGRLDHCRIPSPEHAKRFLD